MLPRIKLHSTSSKLAVDNQVNHVDVVNAHIDSRVTEGV